MESYGNEHELRNKFHHTWVFMTVILVIILIKCFDKFCPQMPNLLMIEDPLVWILLACVVAAFLLFYCILLAQDCKDDLEEKSLERRIR